MQLEMPLQLMVLKFESLEGAIGLILALWCGRLPFSLRFGFGGRGLCIEEGRMGGGRLGQLLNIALLWGSRLLLLRFQKVSCLGLFSEGYWPLKKNLLNVSRLFVPGYLALILKSA